MWGISDRPLHRGMLTLRSRSYVEFGDVWKGEREKGIPAAKNRDGNTLTRQRLIQHPLNPRAAPQVHPTLRKRNSAVFCADLISRAVAGTKAEWVGNDGFGRVKVILGF